MKLVEFTMSDRDVPVCVNPELVTYCYANPDRPGTVSILFAHQHAVLVKGTLPEITQILQTGKYFSEEDREKQQAASRAALRNM